MAIYYCNMEFNRHVLLSRDVEARDSQRTFETVLLL